MGEPLIPETNEIVRYVARYGGMCRDCADEHGICPRNGMACSDSEKAIRHVIGALNYGFKHGFISPNSPTPPAPSTQENDNG